MVSNENNPINHDWCSMVVRYFVLSYNTFSWCVLQQHVYVYVFQSETKFNQGTSTYETRKNKTPAVFHDEYNITKCSNEKKAITLCRRLLNFW